MLHNENLKKKKLCSQCVCVAAGSGQLTSTADCDLLGELGWAESCTAAVSVCVCVLEGKERGTHCPAVKAQPQSGAVQ